MRRFVRLGSGESAMHSIFILHLKEDIMTHMLIAARGLRGLRGLFGL